MEVGGQKCKPFSGRHTDGRMLPAPRSLLLLTADGCHGEPPSGGVAISGAGLARAWVSRETPKPASRPCQRAHAVRPYRALRTLVMTRAGGGAALECGAWAPLWFQSGVEPPQSQNLATAGDRARWSLGHCQNRALPVSWRAAVRRRGHLRRRPGQGLGVSRDAKARLATLPAGARRAPLQGAAHPRNDTGGRRGGFGVRRLGAALVPKRCRATAVPKFGHGGRPGALEPWTLPKPRPSRVMASRR